MSAASATHDAARAAIRVTTRAATCGPAYGSVIHVAQVDTWSNNDGAAIYGVSYVAVIEAMKDLS